MRKTTFFALLLLLAGVAAAGADEKKSPWRVSGELEEACSCDAACPCWFDSQAHEDDLRRRPGLLHRQGELWRRSSGRARGGLHGAEPGRQEHDGVRRELGLRRIYIDEKANPAQRKALEAIARATSPPAAPPERTKVLYTPITRKVEGSEHVVTLGNYGSFSGHLVSGGMGSANPKIVLPPGADPIHKEYSQGRTTKQTYNDAGQKWDWSNSNYMYARFEVTSEDYDKFNAFMMQEMQKAKEKK